jgi:mono-ADP-ribosyltransferase sirtuin 6
LIRRKKAKFLITQNVDGLHLKSGIDSSKLAELHGNVFKEECDDCGKVYCREKPVGTVGLKDTGRTCIEDGCKGKLQDMTLDWGSALPEDDFDDAVVRISHSLLWIHVGMCSERTPHIHRSTPRRRTYTLSLVAVCMFLLQISFLSLLNVRCSL